MGNAYLGGIETLKRLSARVLAGLAGVMVGAVYSTSRALELPAYVTEVVQTHPIVLEELHRYRQEAQDLHIALSGWRPSLDLEASAGRSSREAPNTAQVRKNFNSAEASLSLTQNLFRGFDTTNQVAQARARISSAAYRLYDTADNVALEAIGAYLDVLKENRLVSLAKHNVEVHERILSQILERNRSGIGLRSDVEQTEGRLARAHASLIAQQNNLRDAMTSLHELIGRHIDPDHLFEPAELPELSGTLPSLIDEALREHPAIRSASKNIEASQYGYRRSRSANYPTLDLQVRQDVGSNIEGIDGDTDEARIQLSLRYNLYRGGADTAEQRKQVSVLSEDKAFRDRVRRQVIDTLSLAWSADRSVREQTPYLRTHVEKSRQTLTTYHEEFALNLRDLIDLLDAENEWNTARIRLTEAHYAAAGARFRMYEGVGNLLPALGLDVDLTDDRLRIASLDTAGLDQPELAIDRDFDTLPDQQDQCDNSELGVGVDEYGCGYEPTFELGYPGMGSAPQASDDRLRLKFTAGMPLLIPVDTLLQNDADEDGDELTMLGFSQPSHGTLNTDEDGNLAYVPTEVLAEEDEFTYTVSDGRSRSVTASVRVQLDRPSAPPRIEGLSFAYKRDILTEESIARLDAVVEWLRAQPGASVEVYTYTDDVGSESYNRRLSERRAEKIRQLLIDRGIEAERIETYGMGENNPIAENSTAEGRAANRRAEVKLILPQSY